MAEESTGTVLLAGVSNLAIAIAKTIGGLLSGSTAMLAEAEANAPAIRAATHRVAAMTERAPQAQALPDPLLSLTYANESLDQITWGESMDTGATVTWTQEFPGGGKPQIA